MGISIINHDHTIGRIDAANPLPVNLAAGGAATPTMVNITLTLANTEYSTLMPNDTQSFEFQARTAADVRFAFVAGQVAGSVNPYYTLKSNDYYSSPAVGMTGQTIYFASATAGTVVEFIAWS